MPNFTLTRDDFEKLGRVAEWDKYEDDDERTMRFFVDGVKLTFDELSNIGHKKDYKVILYENKRRKERDIHVRRLPADLEYEYDHRDYVLYYPPEKSVASAIVGFDVDISMLFKTVFDPDTIGYDFVMRLAELIPYVIQEEPELAGGLIDSLFDFRDEVAKSLENWPESGYPAISGMLFANVGFMGMKVLDAYSDKVKKTIQDIHDDKIDLEKTIKLMQADDQKEPMQNVAYKEARDRESDHGSLPGEFPHSMAWRLAQAVLNGEMAFAEYLAKNKDVLVRISRNYGRKSEELEAEANNVRKKFYESRSKEPPQQTYTICIRTFKKYLALSDTPPSNDAEKEKRRKWYFSEIPLLTNSPANFVKLLKKYLNRKYRKNDENND